MAYWDNNNPLLMPVHKATSIVTLSKAIVTTAIGGLMVSSLYAPHAEAQTSDLILCADRVVRSLDFANNTLQSGTANAIGSVYRYSNVGDGVDAEVTVTGFTGGGGISIIDRDTGPVSYTHLRSPRD